MPSLCPLCLTIILMIRYCTQFDKASNNIYDCTNGYLIGHLVSTFLQVLKWSFYSVIGTAAATDATIIETGNVSMLSSTSTISTDIRRLDTRFFVFPDFPRRSLSSNDTTTHNFYFFPRWLNVLWTSNAYNSDIYRSFSALSFVSTFLCHSLPSENIVNFRKHWVNQQMRSDGHKYIPWIGASGNRYILSCPPENQSPPWGLLYGAM